MLAIEHHRTLSLIDQLAKSNYYLYVFTFKKSLFYFNFTFISINAINNFFNHFQAFSSPLFLSLSFGTFLSTNRHSPLFRWTLAPPNTLFGFEGTKISDVSYGT